MFNAIFLNPHASYLKLLGAKTKDVWSCVEKCGQWICRKRWIYNGEQRSAEYGKHCRPPRAVKCQIFCLKGMINSLKIMIFLVLIFFLLFTNLYSISPPTFSPIFFKLFPKFSQLCFNFSPIICIFFFHLVVPFFHIQCFTILLYTFLL